MFGSADLRIAESSRRRRRRQLGTEISAAVKTKFRRSRKNRRQLGMEAADGCAVAAVGAAAAPAGPRPGAAAAKIFKTNSKGVRFPSLFH